MRRYLPIMLLVCGLLHGPQPVLASSPPLLDKAAARTALQGEGEGTLTVTPDNIVTALAPGSQTTRLLTVTNESGSALNVELQAEARGIETLSTELVLDYSLLVVTPRLHPDADLLASALARLEGVAFSFWDPTQGTPTASDLLPYDVVLIGNLLLWELGGLYRDGLGDALADYVDGGGKIIDTLLLHADDGWGLTGRYRTEGYAPVATASGFDDADRQVEINADEHLLVRGLEAPVAHGSLIVTARDDAVVPATIAGTSSPYLAANESVVFINAQLFDDQTDAELETLLHNAVRYLCGERTPWLSLEPSQLQLADGESGDVTVTLDSSPLSSPAIYDAEIHFGGSEALFELLTVSVELAVLDEPAMGRLGGVISADRSMAPLVNVQVEVEATNSAIHTAVSGEDGSYRFWLTPGSYALSAAQSGYCPYDTNISIAADAQVQHDVVLIYDAPWLVLTPERLVIDDQATGPVSRQLHIDNHGTKPLEWSLEISELADWLVIAPQSGTLAPGDGTSIEVIVETATAPPGWSVIDLPLSSNDPLQSPLAVRLYVRHGGVVLLPAAFGLPKAAAQLPDS